MVSVLRQAFDLEPKEAVEFLRQKGFRTTFNWAEMLKDEHDVDFTVAKMADMDLLKEVKQAVDKAITAGTTKKDFADSLEPLLQSRGWWGRKVVTDPNTGEEKEVQLGSSRRLETIFRTNLKTAYAAGRYQQIQDTKEGFPFLMYDAVDDDRTRPEHAAWDGLVLPVDDDWWKTHYPPNGWNCRCCVIQVNDRMLSKMGKEGPDTAPNYGTRPWVNPATQETEQVPVGIDPGWDYAPGASRVDQVQEVLDEKLVDMPEDWVDATNRSMEPINTSDTPAGEKSSEAGPTEGEKVADLEDNFIRRPQVDGELPDEQFPEPEPTSILSEEEIVEKLKVLGVESDFKGDVVTARLTMKAVLRYQEKGLPFPKSIKKDDRPFVDQEDPKTLFGKYDHRQETFFLNGLYRTDGYLADAKEMLEIREWETDEEDHAHLHELGHAAHHQTNPTLYSNMPEWHPDLAAKQLKGKVSNVALESPRQFVAEVTAGLVAGKTYDDVVMKWYRHYGGPWK